MHLAQSTFEYVLLGSFKLQQRIIYAYYRATQTWLGGIILTQIAQGYTKGARKFSHYAAGCSNGSAYTKTPTVCQFEPRWTVEETIVVICPRRV